MTPKFHNFTSNNIRRHVAGLLEPALSTIGSRLVRGFNICVVLAGVLAAVLATDPVYGVNIELPVKVILLLFTIEYLFRLWTAPELATAHPPEGRRLRWALSPFGLLDLSSVLLIPLALAAGAAPTAAYLFGVLWIFKLARYSHGLAVLGRVVEIEAEPLLGVLFAFLIVLLIASVLAYLIEGPNQPDQFGSVPKAMWWAIVTLTTTGYGDVVPLSTGGRVLSGLVMMCGIIVFALWAGILATGFSQEMRRRAFLRTWDLVSRVPLFRDVGAAVISEVAQRLRPREVGRGTVILRKGEVGDCMYFIVHGEVVVDLGPTFLHLRDGAFMGELSLITGARRNASAMATRQTQLLILDIADFRDLAARHPDLTAAIHLEAERRLNNG
ncbi:MAG: cyclic nucleotide-gated ion channel [Rhodospirillaceae bacterium]